MTTNPHILTSINYMAYRAMERHDKFYTSLPIFGKCSYQVDLSPSQKFQGRQKGCKENIKLVKTALINPSIQVAVTTYL